MEFTGETTKGHEMFYECELGGGMRIMIPKGMLKAYGMKIPTAKQLAALREARKAAAQ